MDRAEIPTHSLYPDKDYQDFFFHFFLPTKCLHCKNVHPVNVIEILHSPVFPASTYSTQNRKRNLDESFQKLV